VQHVFDRHRRRTDAAYRNASGEIGNPGRIETRLTGRDHETKKRAYGIARAGDVVDLLRRCGNGFMSIPVDEEHAVLCRA